MSKDLITLDTNDKLLVEQPELQQMLVNIQEALPEIRRATKNFGKRNSQWMYNTLTLSKPTTLRNIKQCLAEIEKTSRALRENHFKKLKQDVELKMKLRDAENETDELKRELLLIEADEMYSQHEESMKYISGAIRKLENYQQNYKMLQKKAMEEQGVDTFDEIDHEKAEEKYHIMTAFSQGLDCVRAHGRIDQGNQIYLQQLGINGAVAQVCMVKLVNTEKAIFEKGLEPTNELILQFLEDMAKKFEGCSTKMAEHKGINLIVESAVVAPRLLEVKK